MVPSDMASDKAFDRYLKQQLCLIIPLPQRLPHSRGRRVPSANWRIHMVRQTVSRALFVALLFVSFLPVRSFAGCNVAIVSTIAPTDPAGTATLGQITFSTIGTPAGLQKESTMERTSDILIYDDTTVAGGNCFVPTTK